MTSGTGRLTGPWLIILAACLWGTTGTAQGLAPIDASSMTVGAVRLTIGGAVLVAVAHLRHGGGWVGVLRQPSALIAAAGMAAYQPLFFGGVARTGVGIGTAIAIGSAPVLTGAVTTLLGVDRPSGRWIRSTATAVAGVTLLTIAATTDPSLDGLGALMTLGAGLAYATYATAARRLAPKARADVAAAGVFGLAGAALLPVALLGDLGWLTTRDGVLVAGWLGLAATAIAYLLFTAGIATVAAPRAATLSLAEPIMAMVLAVLVLSERPEPIGWLGAALVVIGLGAMARRDAGTTEVHRR